MQMELKLAEDLHWKLHLNMDECARLDREYNKFEGQPRKDIFTQLWGRIQRGETCHYQKQKTQEMLKTQGNNV